ncbi:uncharacterized protein B0P05DRAFT_592557 [Gilbertella persicaria]|uniref:uncharacterized protein n=1 Tax=Gilbertella persicaria TaxID=101096 RepID=UPI00222075DA|nr:uncharacterized protein B0P05DRAFT_592557 [Gilbertella persicaria]KAI8047683.1 hypothetical protein B0P05DRAFT_592557 [Gilbertella persicaria]
MLTKQSIDPFIDNHDTKKLDPLVVFVHFLSSGQQNIIIIDRWDDPTNPKLYFVTMEMVKNDIKTENDKVEALQTICQATQNQFEKIMTTVFDNPSRAHQYAEAGQHYNASLELPKDFDGASSSINSKYKDLIAFIDAWEQNNKGRMNWSACWEDGKKKGQAETEKKMLVFEISSPSPTRHLMLIMSKDALFGLKSFQGYDNFYL